MRAVVLGRGVITTVVQVEKNKYFLVNLNADPSLNELLVYYLKERSLVGREDAALPQDIQLSGTLLSSLQVQYFSSFCVPVLIQNRYRPLLIFRAVSYRYPFLKLSCTVLLRKIFSVHVQFFKLQCTLSRILL